MLPIIINPLGHRQPCYIYRVSKDMVLVTPLNQRLLTPTEKRGFVTSKFWAVVRLHLGHALNQGAGFMDWMARVATPGARLVPRYEHPVHLLPVVGKWWFQSQPGAEAMTVVALASRRAAPVSPTTPTKAEQVQLHARACNDLHMQAMNALHRCIHMLTATEPMYTFAMQDLDAAKAAVEALQWLKGGRP